MTFSEQSALGVIITTSMQTANTMTSQIATTFPVSDAQGQSHSPMDSSSHLATDLHKIIRPTIDNKYPTMHTAPAKKLPTEFPPMTAATRVEVKTKPPDIVTETAEVPAQTRSTISTKLSSLASKHDATKVQSSKHTAPSKTGFTTVVWLASMKSTVCMSDLIVLFSDHNRCLANQINYINCFTCW